MASTSSQQDQEINEEHEGIVVIDVWNHNLEAEIAIITDIVKDFNVVTFDTEFPGALIKVPSNASKNTLLAYAGTRENVNNTKLIQLGLTLGDNEGNLPKDENKKFMVWQFNFCDFDPKTDKSDPDSIQLLEESGLNFDLLMRDGIPLLGAFGETLLSAGVFKNINNLFVQFNGYSDMAYLIKLFTKKDLPPTYDEFMSLVTFYFPCFVDVKFISNLFMEGNTKGLEFVSNQLGVKRTVGIPHQAASDSHLTYMVFLKMGNEEKHKKYFNKLWGFTS